MLTAWNGKEPENVSNEETNSSKGQTRKKKITEKVQIFFGKYRDQNETFSQNAQWRESGRIIVVANVLYSSRANGERIISPHL